MAKIKLIFFDMEGTIFKKAVRLSHTSVAPSAWCALAQRLSPRAYEEERLTQDKWNKGLYSSYIEWMEETIKIHKKYKLTKSLFLRVIDSIEYMPGVRNVFKFLNTERIPTCLISGGFKYQGDKALVDLGIRHSFVACEYFWDKKGYLKSWNLLPADEEGKLDFMKLIIKEYKFSKTDCAFVGDGENDIPIAKSVGISIAFNGSPLLQRNATYSINQRKGKENLLEILKYLFPF